MLTKVGFGSLPAASRDRRAIGFLLCVGARHLIQTPGMTEVLLQQRLEILGSQLLEKRIQAAERRAGKAGGRRPLLQRQFAKRKFRLEPVAG